MKMYRLYTVVPKLTKFIDQLTNWYVRLNRQRIKGEMGTEECIKSLDTLYDVLFTMVKMMAPFTPFITEYIFKRLVLFQPENAIENIESVHYQIMPISNRSFIRVDIEKSVSLMQNIIELGRVMRDRRNWPIKYPVSEIIVIHKDPECLKAIQSLEDFILRELNVHKLTLSSDKQKYGVMLRAEPNHKVLGQRLKGSFKSILNVIKSLSDADIQLSFDVGYFLINGERIELDEVNIIYSTADKSNSNFEVHSNNDVLLLMDMTLNNELMEEGIAREIINRVQKLKKKAHLIPTDPVYVYYQLSHITQKPKSAIQILNALKTHYNMIKSTIKSDISSYVAKRDANRRRVISQCVDIRGIDIIITICSNNKIQQSSPCWVNVILSDHLQPRYKRTNKASLLIRNPSTRIFLTLDEFKNELNVLFGIYGMRYKLFVTNYELVWQLSFIDGHINGCLVVVGSHLKNAVGISKQYINQRQPFCKLFNDDNDGNDGNDGNDNNNGNDD